MSKVRKKIEKAKPYIAMMGGTVIEGLLMDGVVEDDVLNSMSNHRHDWTTVVLLFARVNGEITFFKLLGKVLNEKVDMVAGHIKLDVSTIEDRVKAEDHEDLEVISVGFMFSPNRNGIPSNYYHKMLELFKEHGAYNKEVANMALALKKDTEVNKISSFLGTAKL